MWYENYYSRETVVIIDHFKDEIISSLLDGDEFDSEQGAFKLVTIATLEIEDDPVTISGMISGNDVKPDYEKRSIDHEVEWDDISHYLGQVYKDMCLQWLEALGDEYIVIEMPASGLKPRVYPASKMEIIYRGSEIAEGEEDEFFKETEDKLSYALELINKDNRSTHIYEAQESIDFLRSDSNGDNQKAQAQCSLKRIIMMNLNYSPWR